MKLEKRQSRTYMWRIDPSANEPWKRREASRTGRRREIKEKKRT